MKVYLVYDSFCDNEEQATYDYLMTIRSSIEAAKGECVRLATDIINNDDADAKLGIDNDGNTTVYRSNGDENHFVIEEWTVQ